MKHALLAASLVLVAGTAVGCGGGPPTDASAKDFCKVFDDFNVAATELGEDAETADRIKAIKDVGKELEEVGTPEDISDDARAGFEVTVEAIADIPDDASEEEMDKYLEDSLSDEEQKQSEAFDDYVSETCESA